ncbi:related to KAR4 - transcription factor required for gene regulation in response to pheromones [Melanopsichium pennsylvanicum]|uniref:Related to KAR4 - transcription factor required for gene regulation in response to pheromones n=2 Tax=Melanopsichium pennsylvanicum TaxID=63383 RepID=A0AAJ4XK65_9BASI|nr:mt-a70-domain-containing protein [Melanopsichium pennsylvanicum 4]SNX83472.1 related to KAR4 - transcription factor required for gene regulation in response to pheromones [Melanopsichium pennsylvanicum]
MAVESPFISARDHPRWRTLVHPNDTAREPSSSRHQQQQRLKHLRQRIGLSVSNNDREATAGTAAPLDTKHKAKAIPTNSALGPNYSASEQTLRNDYSQHFVDTGAGQLPGNAVRNPSSSTRFDEYPKLKRLVQLKDSLVTRVAHPPTYLQADLRTSLRPFRDPSRSINQFHLGSLIPVKYDVVLIDPPLEAYEWESTPTASASVTSGAASNWSWEEIAALPVPQLAAKESFVFLWVGSGAGDGLERGREVLAKWGYRRCEDIVCIRTNPGEDHASSQQPSTSSAFTRSSQHCLMGIRGTVRRSTDARFVHCNIDTDVILWPGPEGETESQSARERDDVEESTRRMLPDMVSKPSELYQTIENFCLGTRRLELFGRNRNLRRGWLTVGLEVGPDAPGWPDDSKVAIPPTGMPIFEEIGIDPNLAVHFERLQHPRPYDKNEYDANFGVDRPGCDLRDRSNLVPYVEEVDQLRPKSPPPRGGNDSHARNGNSWYRVEPDYRLPQDLHQSGAQGTMMPNGLSSNPTLHKQHGNVALHAHGVPAGTIVLTHPTGLEFSIMSGVPVRGSPGGAGLSGLGAGGARTVSVPSGSDTLSGPQASVLKAKAIAEAAAAAACVNSGDSAPV